MNQQALIEQRIEEQRTALLDLVRESATIADIARRFSEAFKSGNKILICGNGGSAADAQHVAGEFMGHFKKERAPLPAIALTTDPSVLTAIGNDYRFEDIFARQVEALAKPGDIVVGISTSGNSKNVLEAMRVARERGCATIGITGHSGGALREAADVCLRVPSDDTQRIQEMHILAWHIICELVDEEMAACAV